MLEITKNQRQHLEKRSTIVEKEITGGFSRLTFSNDDEETLASDDSDSMFKDDDIFLSLDDTNSSISSLDSQIVTPESFDSLGPARIFKINDEKTMAIPKAFHFRFRGEQLRHMNRMEWHSLIQIQKRRMHPKKTKDGMHQNSQSLVKVIQ